jgi:tetratricopeptide (TPR) repeat protein
MMKKDQHSEHSGYRDQLPESLEKARQLYETEKQYERGRKHWGRLTAAILIFILVIGLIWRGWPEIRRRPSIPACEGQNFCVAVAQVQNDPDDKFGTVIVDALESLQGKLSGPGSSTKAEESYTGIEVIRIPLTISTSGNKTRVAEQRAFARTRYYLEKSHADLLIWGIVVPAGSISGPRIFWTTREATERSIKLLSFQGLDVSEEFMKKLASLLQLLVVTQYEKFSGQDGRYVADQLAPFIRKVRALVPQTNGAGWTDDSRFTIKLLLANSLSLAGDNGTLEEAIGYYRELSQWNDHLLQRWEIQVSLGNTLLELGKRESGIQHLTEALAAYRAARSWPGPVGAIENSLGNALRLLGERAHDLNQLCQALGYHVRSWEIYSDISRYPSRFAVAGAKDDAEAGVKEDVETIHKQSPGTLPSCLQTYSSRMKRMGIIDPHQ